MVPRGWGAGFTETDAYALLGLLLRFEPDPAASWRNHLEQELSVDRLLAAARAVYLSGPPVGDAIDDHTKLHLVELLLAHDALRPPGPGANAVKERFLAVELGRERFDGEVGSEVLAHTVESLGRLLASPRVSWTPEEARRVRRWLLVLERDRYPDLDRVPLQHLAHTLEGLRLVAASGTIPRP